MHPQLVAGARVGFNDNSATMGNWGQGARSALPMVGEVFQQALRQRVIDAKVEFDIPRPKPRPPPEVVAPQEPASAPTANPVIDAIGEMIEGLLRQVR